MKREVRSIVLRNSICRDDIDSVRRILSSTGFFEQAPDEIDVASELATLALKDGNNVDNYDFIFADSVLAGESDRTVGFACFAKIPCTLTTYEIYWLGVDKSQQGRGTGRIIIEEIKKYVKSLGGKKLILYTAGREQYVPTHKFYAACNFVEEARVKDYYAEGDDCVIYSVSLL